MVHNYGFSQDLKHLGTIKGDHCRRRYRFVMGVGALFAASGLAAAIGTFALSPKSTPAPGEKAVITARPNAGVPASNSTRTDHRAPPAAAPMATTDTPARAEDPSTRVASPATTEKWRTVTVRRGDTLAAIFSRFSLKPNEAYLASRPAGAGILNRLLPGKTLKVSAGTDGYLRRLVYQIDPAVSLHVTRQEGTGGTEYAVTRETRKLDIRIRSAQSFIESSLFEAGMAAGLSDPMIMKLVAIFGWDVDFALDLRKGDRFAVIYEEKYWQGEKMADGEIIAAEFINQGKVFRAIRHKNLAGRGEYYSPEGLSLRRTFLRTPVKFTRISSRFSKRRFHPVLKRWRSHKGVDYAARAGTPILATADGRVKFVGRKGGYGKMVIIKHGGAYSTLYAHLSRFKRGLRRGGYVKQGQVIAYVGKTGLATGPHLHYEFRVHGRHINPLRFKQPKAEPIKAKYRQRFLEQARVWEARLDMIGSKLRVANSEVRGTRVEMRGTEEEGTRDEKRGERSNL